MKKEIGYCNKCGFKFSYELIHNGFNETAYAYCDSCGKTLFLEEHYKQIPQTCLLFFKIKDRYEKINRDIEQFLEKCECGGKFARSTKPRCPHCKEVLSTKNATEFIFKNSKPGSINSGWRISWNSLYAIIINNKKVYNKWK